MLILVTVHAFAKNQRLFEIAIVMALQAINFLMLAQ